MSKPNNVDTDVRPLFFKARSMPYALRQKVELELERLPNQDVITPVSHSEWATPILPVVQRDGSVHVCGDCKLTANKVSKIKMYLLPHIDDLFAALSGSNFFEVRFFTCLSASPAFQCITEIPCYKHPQGTLRVQETAIWGFIFPYKFSMYHGQFVSGNPRVCALLT